MLCAIVLGGDILYGYCSCVVRFILTIVGIDGLWNIVNYIEDKITIKTWMKQSFFIYCSHGTFYFLTKKLIYMFSGTNPINIFVGWWIIFALNILGIYIMYKIFERCGKVLKVLSGGR